MATLIFGSLGTALGGPIGGAIGSMIGRQVDTMLLGGGSHQGPRLKELAVTTSTYGSILPRHFGRMRVAGTVIWATDLVEHSETLATNSGTITTYQYSANLAVALASRPIHSIGRIWADGKLLRGANGDLQVSATLRIYNGHGDQSPDPLLSAAEGASHTPAYRDLAYVVFEGLDLTEYYNRIPALTFEVIAEDSFDLQTILGDLVDGINAPTPLTGVIGYTSEGSAAVDLETFAQVMPLEIDASDTRITIAHADRQIAAIPLTQPAIAVEDDAFGGRLGFVRNRAPHSPHTPTTLRYYDVDRDYQPSVQRATGRADTRNSASLDLPAAINAGTARSLIERAAQHFDWKRDHIAWRTSALNPAVAPGSIVSLPNIDGLWRVREWEWRASGVELALERAVPTVIDTTPMIATDPGRSNPPSNVITAPTQMVAFELPLDRCTGQSDTSRPFAALSSANASWRGAALYADRGDGQLHPLAPSGRNRTVMGTAHAALPDASPLLLDRGSNLIITLIDPAMTLSSATMDELAQGHNFGLVGDELVQFLNATPLGQGQWQISGLLRGCSGTELAIPFHGEGEPFVLLNLAHTPLSPETLGSAPQRRVVAMGMGDASPVTASVRLDGITKRPLSPVHPHKIIQHNGVWTLSWTRRSRGGAKWEDGIDVPLGEQREAYLVTYGPIEAPIATWTVTQPHFDIDESLRAHLLNLAPGEILRVHQQGTHALSPPLPLCPLI